MKRRTEATLFIPLLLGPYDLMIVRSALERTLDILPKSAGNRDDPSYHRVMSSLVTSIEKINAAQTAFNQVRREK